MSRPDIGELIEKARPTLDPISRADFELTLKAEPDTPCSTCGHIKYEHYSAGPVCMICDCRRYRVTPEPCTPGCKPSEGDVCGGARCS